MTTICAIGFKLKRYFWGIVACLLFCWFGNSMVLIPFDQSANRFSRVGTTASKDQVIFLDPARFNNDVDRLTAGPAPYITKQLCLH